MEFILLRDESELKRYFTKKELAAFLHEYLGKFGDPVDQIRASLDYAFSGSDGKGGFIALALEESGLVGALVMNNTGMRGYIPPYILVYVAVDRKHRGKGIGGKLIEFSLKQCDGPVKLHVEYDNPAKRLYERLGFKSKYAEMRFDGKSNG